MSVAVSLLAVVSPLCTQVRWSKRVRLHTSPLARGWQGLKAWSSWRLADFGTDGTVARELSVVQRSRDVSDCGCGLRQRGGGPESRYSGETTHVSLGLFLTCWAMATKPQVSGATVQHYIVFGAAPPCLCDPPAELRRKRRRFLVFPRWISWIMGTVRLQHCAVGALTRQRGEYPSQVSEARPGAPSKRRLAGRARGGGLNPSWVCRHGRFESLANHASRNSTD